MTDTSMHYMPIIIEYVQRGTLSPVKWDLPDEVHTAIYFLAFGSHRLYIFTMVLGNTTVFLNALGWISTIAAWLGCLSLCTDLKITRIKSLVVCCGVFSAPLVVCEAANTNYDQHAGFCAVMAILFLLRFIAKPTHSPILLTAMAQVALGASKLTSIYLLPGLISLNAVIFWRCRKDYRPVLTRYVIITGIIGSIVLVPHFARLYSTFGYFYPVIGPTIFTISYQLIL